MEQNAQNAYEQFLQTGKVSDYLRYTEILHSGASGVPVPPHPTGEHSAYYDRRDRSVGARG